MDDVPLRDIRRSREKTLVRWPGAPPGADPWDDGFFRVQAESKPEFAPLFEALERRRRDGEHEEFLGIAADLGLDGDALHDRNTPAWGLPTASLDELIRLAADLWPAVGIEGPELVLGQASLFAGQQRLRTAVAGCPFLWAYRRWPSVFTAWCRTKPRPPVPVRERFRTVGLAPWALWRVERRSEGIHLRDVTGLAPAYQPTGPVTVIGEQPSGEGLAARVLRSDQGWVAHTALDVPTLPSSSTIRSWIHEELILARTFRPEIRIEPLLRHRAILVRRVL